MSLKKNTMWNFIGSIAPMLLGLITVPYLITQIQLEAFGILTLVWALIGYFSIFDFGIGRALTHQISSKLSDGKAEKLPGIVKTGILFMIVFGTAGGILLAALAHEFGFNWLNVSGPLQQSTVNCLLIASLGIPLATVASGLKGVLEGYEEFRIANILRILLGVANFGLPALTVMFFGASLEYMVISLVAARLVILVAHLIVVNAKLPYWMRSRILGKEKTIELLTFGAWMTLSNIISPLMVTADRFIISFILGAGLVAFYTVPFDFIIRLLVIPAALTSVLFPRFTYLFKSDFEKFALLYKKSFNIIFLVMAPIVIIIAAGSFWGLSLWLGVDFAKNSWAIFSVLSIGLLFNSLAQIPHAAIQAAGGVKATALVHAAEFTLYLPLLLVALKFHGLLGAAIVWVVRVFCDLLILMFIAKKKMA